MKDKDYIKPYDHNYAWKIDAKRTDYAYLDKWDQSDILPKGILRDIRDSDRHVFYNKISSWIVDNNDPATCDMRLKAMEITEEIK